MQAIPSRSAKVVVVTTWSECGRNPVRFQRQASGAGPTLEWMQGFGRLLIYAGVFIVLLGVCVLAAEKLGLPLGRLPGDFAWRGKRSSVYFPLATCLLLSVVLSLLLYLFNHLRR